jgi:lipopolysaccharide transport system ATP-binding protein
MSEPVISVENLSKKFLIGSSKSLDLRHSIFGGIKNLFSGAPDMEEFWALKDINFEVEKGNAIGIIGRNGAGKSTLLKILSRITSPTTGKFEIIGRVSSLLEVGTGFHPELTGRENIFLNGTILGMKKREIRTRFDQIVDFSGVEKFIDTPVKHFSSGMKVRLAFSVAAHLEPEILIVDEVLAVGDSEFQKKCIGKMNEVTQTNERVVVFVSHNLSALRTLCKKGIYLEDGTIRYSGDIDNAVERYLARHDREDQSSVQNLSLTSTCQVEEFTLGTTENEALRDLNFKIIIKSAEPNSISELSILVYSEFQERVAIVDLRDDQLMVISRKNSRIVIEGILKNLPFVEGKYSIGLYIISNQCSGNFFDLLTMQVSGRKSEVAPYPANVRGYVELDKNFRIYA